MRNAPRATLMGVDHADRAKAGQWLRAQRERRRYKTAAALAVALSVDPSWVSRFERGEIKEISDERVERIAWVLGLPVKEVRRHLGLWVGDDEVYWPSIDEFIARTALTAEGKQHWRRQYDLLPKEPVDLPPDTDPSVRAIVETLMASGVEKDTALEAARRLVAERRREEPPDKDEPKTA